MFHALSESTITNLYPETLTDPDALVHEAAYRALNHTVWQIVRSKEFRALFSADITNFMNVGGNLKRKRDLADYTSHRIAHSLMNAQKDVTDAHSAINAFHITRLQSKDTRSRFIFYPIRANARIKDRSMLSSSLIGVAKDDLAKATPLDEDAIHLRMACHMGLSRDVPRALRIHRRATRRHKSLARASIVAPHLSRDRQHRAAQLPLMSLPRAIQRPNSQLHIHNGGSKRARAHNSRHCAFHYSTQNNRARYNPRRVRHRGIPRYAAQRAATPHAISANAERRPSITPIPASSLAAALRQSRKVAANRIPRNIYLAQWGRTGSTGDRLRGIAGRGDAYLDKNGKNKRQLSKVRSSSGLAAATSAPSSLRERRFGR